MGGGHGLAATIRAVRRYAGSTLAVVATADDGGSTGRLRSAKDMLAPGDLRRCLVAMAGVEQLPLGRALEYRFAGTDVEGHALGNLLLAALGEVTGDFLAAVDEVGRLLDLDPAVAWVQPATVEPVRLVGETVDGEELVGQSVITATGGVARIRLEPAGAKPPPGLVDAIAEADQVVLGPGSLYTSVLAAAVVDDLRDALAETKAQKVFVCNLRADGAEAFGYDLARYLGALRAHGVHPDVVVVPEAVGGAAEGVQVVRADVSRPHGLAHDSVKLGTTLTSLLP